MKLRRDDGDKAVSWAREHWHVAFFLCACIGVLSAILVDVGLLSERAGLAAGLASAVYVLLTTWNSTHEKRFTVPPSDPTP